MRCFLISSETVEKVLRLFQQASFVQAPFEQPFITFAPCAPVAQLDRALVSEAEGHAFESHRVYAKNSSAMGSFF